MWSVRQARGNKTDKTVLLVERTDGTSICAEDITLLDSLLNQSPQFQGTATTLCDLPPGGIPTDTVEVCGFIDETGHVGWVYRVGGTIGLSRLVGMLELAKHHVISEAWTDTDEPPTDTAYP
jgi:hypothetical protein